MSEISSENSDSSSRTVILGFDPGRDKCGIAVKAEAQILHLEVVAAERAITTLQKLCDRFAVTQVVMGNQTTSKSWLAKLEDALTLSISLVDERFSTVEGRTRYWELFPAKGLQKLIPGGLRVPPREIDDLAALVLIERFLSTDNSTAEV
ncbi:MAG: Holliday junction resolvase RuvX [Cyanobacteria bacterium P01_H01_bin.15]